MNYTQLINDNMRDFTDPDQITDFIDSYIDKDGKNLTELEDNISEYADGLVPIYYYDIDKEWQENTDCHELTLDVIGEYNQKDGIYKMMSSDLYFWHEQRIQEDYNKLLEIIAEQPAECDICHKPEDDDGRCECTNADATP